MDQHAHLAALVSGLADRLFGGESPAVVLADESAGEIPGLFDELYAAPARPDDVGAPLRRFAETAGTGSDRLQIAFAFFQATSSHAPHLVPESLRPLFAAIAAHTDAPAGQQDLLDAGALLARAKGAGPDEVIGLLDSAVRTLRRSVATFAPADFRRFHAVGLLCGALRLRFTLTGRVDDLSEGVGLLHASMRDWPDDPLRGALHRELSVVLRLRADRTGDRADLDGAVDQARLAIDNAQGHEEVVADALAALGAALLARAAWIHSPDDVEEALTVARRGISASAPDLDRLEYAAERLVGALHARYETFGDVGGLVESVEVARRWAEAAEDASLNTAGRRTMLCVGLLSLAQATGSTALLNEAIAEGQAVVEGLPPVHPRAGLLWVNLSDCYRRRYEVTRSVADVRAAVDAAKEALAAAPAGHPDRSKALFALAGSLWWQFERLGDAADLDAALGYARKALDATAYDQLGYPKIAGLLGQMAAAAAAEQSGVDAFAEAVAAGRTAVASLPEGHPNLPPGQSSLAVVLRLRAEATGQLSDLDESIRLDRAAADQVAPDHPDRARYFCNLGNTLRLRFQADGNEEDLRDSLRCFRAALDTTTALPSSRLQAAASLGRMAGEARQWDLAADGYTAALDLLPLVTAPTLLRTDQEFVLSRQPGLAADAAACLLRAGKPEQAVQLWDQGRGVLLAQALGLRSDLAQLADHHPELAKRVAAAWDRALRSQADVASDLKELIDEVRGLPGWENFLALPTVVDPRAATRGGPVVVVNVSQFGSDALLINPTGIDVLPLPGLTPVAVQDQVIRFLDASKDADAAAERDMHQTLFWLWNEIAGPVLDRLGVTATPATGEPWPRLWWCVSGLLSFLPLHAAGDHDTRFDPEPQTVIDRVVSSYTPTITALIRAQNDRAPAPNASDPLDVLIVAQPKTPGLRPLPWVPTEVAHLKTRLPGQVTELSGEYATRDTVLRALTSSRWAHFACHGTSNLVAPSSSSLLFHDHQNAPLTVIDLMPLQLDRAELAFLSACETARPGAQLSDEAIHLTTACQLAGFRDVIGTLWTIADHAAVEFADAFYDTLLGTPGDVAAALHAATRRTRDAWLRRPSLWAAHIHVGP